MKKIFFYIKLFNINKMFSSVNKQMKKNFSKTKFFLKNNDISKEKSNTKFKNFFKIINESVKRNHPELFKKKRKKKY